MTLTTKLDEAFLIHGHNSYPEIRVRVKTKRGEPFLYLVVGHLREIFHGVYPQTLHFVQSNVRRIQDDTSPLNVILTAGPRENIRSALRQVSERTDKYLISNEAVPFVVSLVEL